MNAGCSCCCAKREQRDAVCSSLPLEIRRMPAMTGSVRRLLFARSARTTNCYQLVGSQSYLHRQKRHNEEINSAVLNTAAGTSSLKILNRQQVNGVPMRDYTCLCQHAVTSVLNADWGVLPGVWRRVVQFGVDGGGRCLQNVGVSVTVDTASVLAIVGTSAQRELLSCAACETPRRRCL
jgi:hypothetical protein